jgi:hypothetical protein
MSYFIIYICFWVIGYLSTSLLGEIEEGTVSTVLPAYSTSQHTPQYALGMLSLDSLADSLSRLGIMGSTEPDTCQRALCSQASGQLGWAAQAHMPAGL